VGLADDRRKCFGPASSPIRPALDKHVWPRQLARQATHDVRDVQVIARKYGLEHEAQPFSKHKMGKAAEFDQNCESLHKRRERLRKYI